MMLLVPTVDEAVLVQRFAGGDADAFSEFYRRYLPAVTGFHLRRTGRRDLAFDLAAETFAEVIVSAASYDPARGAPSSWLFGIAANVLHSSLRRQRVEDAARARLGHEPVSLHDKDLERVEELASLVTEQDFEQMLSPLPAAQREAILARVVQERSYAEIAERMECSPAVVRQRVRRGLRRLRQNLEEQS